MNNLLKSLNPFYIMETILMVLSEMQSSFLLVSMRLNPFYIMETILIILC